MNILDVLYVNISVIFLQECYIITRIFEVIDLCDRYFLFEIIVLDYYLAET
jgi:hypothetical protein